MSVFASVTASSVLQVLYPGGYSVNKANIEYSMVRCLRCLQVELSLVVSTYWNFSVVVNAFLFLTGKPEGRKEIL
jgi:hypothetical protein